MLPPEALAWGEGRNLILVSSCFWWLWAFLGLWPHHSDLCFQGHIAFLSLCVSNLLSFSYRVTCPDNLG